jgi:hypothetical protein
MRAVLRIFAIGLAVLVALAGGLYALSESREVAILRSRDADGAVRSTHLWIVDEDGTAWLRSGGRERGWFRNVAARPEIELERGGETRPYRAVVVDTPADGARVAARMREKYGWIDALILTLEGRPESVAVRLEPRLRAR